MRLADVSTRDLALVLQNASRGDLLPIPTDAGYLWVMKADAHEEYCRRIKEIDQKENKGLECVPLMELVAAFRNVNENVLTCFTVGSGSIQETVTANQKELQDEILRRTKNLLTNL